MIATLLKDSRTASGVQGYSKSLKQAFNWTVSEQSFRDWSQLQSRDCCPPGALMASESSIESKRTNYFP